LSAAREHPAAQVKRQQERDVAVLLPSIRHLTERQYQLFFLFHSAIARHTPQGFTRLVDEDIEQAAAAWPRRSRRPVAESSMSTRRRRLPAQRLATDLTSLLGQIREQGGTVSDAEAAIALRAIEHGARDAKKAGDGTDTSYAVADCAAASGPPYTGRRTERTGEAGEFPDRAVDLLQFRVCACGYAGV
jgi:hypothetical protein